MLQGMATFLTIGGFCSDLAHSSCSSHATMETTQCPLHSNCDLRRDILLIFKVVTISKDEPCFSQLLVGIQRIELA